MRATVTESSTFKGSLAVMTILPYLKTLRPPANNYSVNARTGEYPATIVIIEVDAIPSTVE
jgi:hypothetical protein